MDNIVATIFAVIASIATVFVLSLLLYGIIGGGKTFELFFIQNLVIFGVAAAVAKFWKRERKK